MRSHLTRSLTRVADLPFESGPSLSRTGRNARPVPSTASSEPLTHTTSPSIASRTRRMYRQTSE